MAKLLNYGWEEAWWNSSILFYYVESNRRIKYRLEAKREGWEASARGEYDTTVALKTFVTKEEAMTYIEALAALEDV